MSIQRITCPECKAPLNVGEDAAATKKIKCPKCKAIFSASQRDADPAPAKRKAARRDDFDDEDDRDQDADRGRARRRGPRRDKQGMGAGVLVAIIAASVLLIAGVGFGVYFLVRSLSQETVAEVNNPGPLPGPKPQPGGLVIAPGEIPNLNQQPANPLGPQLGGIGRQIGQTAPEIEGEDIDGQRFKLSDYRGKVVVLDFWGDW